MGLPTERLLAGLLLHPPGDYFLLCMVFTVILTHENISPASRLKADTSHVWVTRRCCICSLIGVISGEVRLIYDRDDLYLTKQISLSSVGELFCTVVILKPGSAVGSPRSSRTPRHQAAPGSAAPGGPGACVLKSPGESPVQLSLRP